MKSSIKLLEVLSPQRESGNVEFEWSCLAFDSRLVKPGCVFFAIPGAIQDGLSYIPDVIEKGAVAVVVPVSRFDDAVSIISDSQIALIGVSDIRLSLSNAAAHSQDYPARSMKCIGITGTNGKTSTAWLVAQLLQYFGKSSVICGTLGIGRMYADSTETVFSATENTTVDPISLQNALRDACNEGIEYAIVEVTSQGIAQKRSHNIDWDVALFTNLSRDHLDIHSSYDEYSEIKFKLFSELLVNSSKENRAALSNVDDKHGAGFVSRIKENGFATSCNSLSVLSSDSDYRVKNARCSLDGISCQIVLPENSERSLCEEMIDVETSLLGNYNYYNLLSALSVVDVLGFDRSKFSSAASKLSTVPGRLERIGNSTDTFVFVDYAHTPDSLSNVLESVASIGATRLTCVFGCGGNRDKGKRSLMASAVEEHADRAIVTSDNPRGEDPEQIVKDTILGFSSEAEEKGFHWEAIVDRRKAIEMAIQEAVPGEVIIIAGKGHEDYQEINGVKYPFLDSKVCEEALRSIGKL